MPACPNGHVSADAEYCDTCGTPIGAKPASSPSASSPSASSSAPSSSATGASAATTACPSCGDLNAASNLFCEGCGFDFLTGQSAPAAPERAPLPTASATPDEQAASPAEPVVAIDPGVDLGWEVSLTVDTEWFAAKGEGIGTPPTRGTTTIEMRHLTAVIGRSRSSGAQPGVVVDDDHGISRRHAELTYDGEASTWSVTDLSSTNGTYVLAAHAAPTTDLAPIPPGIAHGLQPGDRVHIGAWTRLELAQTASASPAADPAEEDPAEEDPAEPESADPAQPDPAEPDTP